MRKRKEPPNLRKIEIMSCYNCDHIEFGYEWECRCNKYNIDDIDFNWVCDSWE